MCPFVVSFYPAWVNVVIPVVAKENAVESRVNSEEGSKARFPPPPMNTPCCYKLWSISWELCGLGGNSLCHWTCWSLGCGWYRLQSSLFWQSDEPDTTCSITQGLCAPLVSAPGGTHTGCPSESPNYHLAFCSKYSQPLQQVSLGWGPDQGSFFFCLSLSSWNCAVVQEKKYSCVFIPRVARI